MSSKAEQAGATRARLVEVAGELFATQGYEGTALEDILAGAGVSKGALYHHFDSKEELFAAVYEGVEHRVMEHILQAGAREQEPLAMLRTAVRSWLDLITDEEGVRRITLVDGPAVLGWQRWRDLDEKYGFGVTKMALAAAMDAGSIRRQPVDMLAHVVLAMLGEIALVIARADDRKAARRDADAMVEGMIGSLAAGD